MGHPKPRCDSEVYHDRKALLKTPQQTKYDSVNPTGVSTAIAKNENPPPQKTCSWVFSFVGAAFSNGFQWKKSTLKNTPTNKM